MNLVLPEMGEGVIEATVSQWLVKVGDVVERMEPVVEVETDKVTTEVVADEAGTITAILIEEGATVAVGVALAEIATGEVVAKNGTHPVTPDPIATNTGKLTRHTPHGRVSPVVARMAAEHDLDLGQVMGTGKNGRITKRDVVAYLDEPSNRPTAVKAPSPKISPPTAQPNTVEKTVPTERPLIGNRERTPENGQRSTMPTPIVNSQSKFVSLTPMRRAIAEHMVESVQTSPHATTIHEVDFSAVSAHRKANKQTFAEKGVNLTFTAYIMQAVAEALNKVPLANSSWGELDGKTGIHLHQEINIGMATAVQDGAGLVVPVIKHAADYNLLGMARTVNELVQKARDNRLTSADMRGGTFTVTNHGVSGSLFATPIINQPQAGILGVGAIKKQVVVIEDEYGNDVTAIRPMAYLSCSFDHRILDGVSADGFVAAVVQNLEAWS